jgi:hypothetical protein
MQIKPFCLPIGTAIAIVLLSVSEMTDESQHDQSVENSNQLSGIHF